MGRLVLYYNSILMKIIEKTTDSLIPYEFNNKLHSETQVNRIANSIKEFWFLQPIVIDKNNIVIVWHWRLEWAKKLWLEKVPCIQVEDLTEEQIKKYRILDNKLNESEWDLANLKLELDSLPNLNIGDIELATFDLFPEFDAPEFDPDDYADETEEEDKWVSLTVYDKDEAELEMLKKDLTELWYTNYK